MSVPPARQKSLVRNRPKLAQGLDDQVMLAKCVRQRYVPKVVLVLLFCAKLDSQPLTPSESHEPMLPTSLVGEIHALCSDPYNSDLRHQMKQSANAFGFRVRGVMEPGAIFIDKEGKPTVALNPALMDAVSKGQRPIEAISSWAVYATTVAELRDESARKLLHVDELPYPFRDDYFAFQRMVEFWKDKRAKEHISDNELDLLLSVQEAGDLPALEDDTVRR